MKKKNWETWLRQNGYVVDEHGNYIGKGFFIVVYMHSIKVYIKDSYVDGWVISTDHGWPNRNPDSDLVLEDLSDRRMKGLLLGGELAYRNRLTIKLLNRLT
jgi:hypothetical protein